VSAFGEFWPYLVLILVGFLPTEIWRLLGVIVGRGADEESELVVWIRSIAVAVLAGVIAKLTLFPPGTLAEVPMALRVGAVAIGLLGFLIARRSVFAGVAAGEIALFAGMFLWPS
jgi:hypothetical protein